MHISIEVSKAHDDNDDDDNIGGGDGDDDKETCKLFTNLLY